MDFELVYKKVAGDLLGGARGRACRRSSRRSWATGRRPGPAAAAQRRRAAARRPPRWRSTSTASRTGSRLSRSRGGTTVASPRGRARSTGSTADAGDFNRFDIREPGPRRLQAWDLGARKLRTVMDSVEDYRLSADGARIVWRRGNDVGIVDATAENAGAAALDLSGLHACASIPAPSGGRSSGRSGGSSATSSTTRRCTGSTGPRSARSTSRSWRRPRAARRSGGSSGR